MLIEGLRLVHDAWRSGVRPHMLFVAPDLLDQNRAAHRLLAEMEADRVEVVRCSDAVFARISETVTPQGIAAIIPLPQLAPQPLPDFVLLLDRIRDPGNAGTLLRSAEAAGVQSVIFCPETVDPFNDKVMRTAMGAHFRLPIQIAADWAEASAMIPPQATIYLAEAQGALAYDAVDWRRPVALVVGGEADGAGDQARSAAIAVGIPMHGSPESLNAGVAGAVILFEASRQRRQGAL